MFTQLQARRNTIIPQTEIGLSYRLD